MLRAASLWMIYCAERLWANVCIRPKFVHKSTNQCVARASERYFREKKRQWLGFNLERWDVWVQGLESGLLVDNQDAKELVEQAWIAVDKTKCRV